MIVFVFSIWLKTLGIRADASNRSLVLLVCIPLTSAKRDSGFEIVSPIPMAAESGLLGSIATSRLAEPTVSLSSANGKAIILGDADLTGIIFDLGTAVYTKSVPDLKADSEARIGAPW